MSILTELMHREITFSQAATKATAWAQSIIAGNAVLTQAAGETLDIVKQAASDAITIGDSALAAHAAPVADAVEAALETALAGATGGVSVVFNPLIDAGVDQFVNVAVAAAHSWALEYKAKLAEPAKIAT
jgi:hypothetical protein